MSGNQHVERSNSNGVYKFNSGALLLGLGAGTVGLVSFGLVGIVAGEKEEFRLGLWVVLLLFSLACIPFLGHIIRGSGRTLEIADDGIRTRDKRGNEIGRIRWLELGRVGERRRLAQLVLWDQLGVQRVSVDQQYEKYDQIRSRVLDEYAKVFTLKPLPIEFRNSDYLRYESFIYAVAAAFFGWASWITYQQQQRGLSTVFVCFAMFFLVSLLDLYPQLRGPSILYDDRLLLQSLFKTEKIAKKDIIDIQIEGVTNSKSGTKCSLMVLRLIDGKTLKIIFKYGSIPEMYVTLRAWWARARDSIS
jgi:hypothetical protein